MLNVLRALLFAPTWIGFLAIRTILIVIGFIVVPIAVLCRAYHVRQSTVYPERIVRAFTSKFMWLYGNEEEGIGYYGEGSTAQKILYSECVRNPVNNLRYVPVASLKIDPSKVRFVGTLGDFEDNLPQDTVRKYDLDAENFWSLTWHGMYSNIRGHFKLGKTRYRFWLGWKIYPEDMYGIPADSHRAARVGFATQFKRI